MTYAGTLNTGRTGHLHSDTCSGSWQNEERWVWQQEPIDSYRIAGSHHMKRTYNKRRVLSPFKKLCQRKNKEIFDSPNQHNDDRFQQLFFMWLQKDKVCLHWDKKQFKFLGWQGWRLGVWTEVNSQREILFYEFREKGLHRSRSLTPPQPPHRLPVLCYASCLEKVGWPGTSQTRFSNSFT